MKRPDGQYTSFMLALKFDVDGQVIDQWLGSNFVGMLSDQPASGAVGISRMHAAKPRADSASKSRVGWNVRHR